MRKGLLVLAAMAVLVLAACSTTTTVEAPADAPSPPPAVPDPDAKGQELAERYLDTLKGADTDTDALDALLAPDYQLVRSDGTRATKEEYLAEPATVDTYAINNVKGTATGNTLVVSFDLTIEEEINGQQISETAPRLGSFVWDGEDWLLLSWANFGVPPQDEGK